MVIAGLAFGVMMLAGFIFGFRAAIGRQERAHALFPTPPDGPVPPTSLSGD